MAEEVIYLDKKWDKEASEILYEYVVKLYNNTPELKYQIPITMLPNPRKQMKRELNKYSIKLLI